MRFLSDFFLLLGIWIFSIPVFFIFVVTSLAGRIFRRRLSLPSLEIKKVSLVIVNYNGKKLLEECLPSVVEDARNCGIEVEIIVVDNGSSDGSCEFLRKRFPEVKLVSLTSNLGFIGGANRGIQESTGEVVVLLNNDMKVERGFIKKLIEPFTDSSVFSTTSQIFFTDPKKRREETGKTRGEWKKTIMNLWHSNRISGKIEHVLYSGGGSSAYRRDVLLKLGGLDSLYHPFYVEDVDISYMGWKRGLRSVLVPQSIVHHQHRGTIGRLYTDREIHSILLKNQILFVWKNISDIKLLISHFFFLPFLLIKKRREGVSVGFTLKSLIKNFPVIVKKRFHEERERRLNDREILKISRKTFPVSPLKVLFVIPYYPYPTIHGGATRMFNVIKHLSEKHKVYLLSFSDGYEKEEQKKEMEKYCEKVKIIRRYGGLIKNITSRHPTPVIEFASPEMRKAIEDVIKEEEPDIVQIEYTQMGQYVNVDGTPLYFITEHDIGFEFFETKYKLPQPLPQKLFDFWEFLRMYYYEIKMLRKYDGIFAMSERDADRLKKYVRNKVPIYVSPNGVDTEFFHYVPYSSREKNSLLFTGYFLHTPNIDAVLWFHKEIYPRIKKEIKNVKVYIVGAYPPKEIKELEDDNFIVTGKVPFTRDYYQSKMVFINPVRYGAGLKLKTVEAMSCGIPVVSTSCGARGIECKNGEDMFITDEPEEFAECVLKLLRDENLWKNFSTNGRKIAEERFDWKIIVREIEKSYFELLKLRWEKL